MTEAGAASRTFLRRLHGFFRLLRFPPLRSASSRSYRLPPCALINLSHGSRGDHGSPRPAAAGSFHAQRQLGSLNHSPRSPFIPTQVSEEPETLPPSSPRGKRSEIRCSAPLQHNKPGAMKAGSKGSRNSPSKGLLQKQQAKVRLSSTHLDARRWDSC